MAGTLGTPQNCTPAANWQPPILMLPYPQETQELILQDGARVRLCRDYKSTDAQSKNDDCVYKDFSAIVNTHYGMISVMFKPQARITTQVGYSITSTDGQTPQFNALVPLGSLQYTYQQPLGNIAVDIGHNLTAKVGWNYYQYGEGSFVGPTIPRYFHANNTTFSLRWAF
jgi:hypothetical protein